MHPGRVTLFRGLIIAALAVTFVMPAQAAIIRWNLNDFTFLDGGVANGFFDWDNVLLNSPNYDIAVSGGNIATFPAFSYTDETTDFQVDALVTNTLVFFDSNVVFRRDFRISLASLADLNTPAAVLSLVGNIATGPAGYVECFNCNPFRDVDVAAEAFLSVNPVPEPATWWLLLGGLMAMLGFARRRE